MSVPRPPAVYRLHVSRSVMVFSVIEHEESTATIEEIHTEYSRR
ncbi:MAG: hypothetical protein ACP5C4_02660 [Methanomicrobiales archaeon]